MTCEDMLNLFTRSFEMSDAESQVLQGVFNQVVEERGSTGTVAGSEIGLDFLGFMVVMRRVIEAGLGPTAKANPTESEVLRLT
eukprot:symbB.v1.2.023268.t1/scaffold2118.1/size88749/3